MDNSFLTAALVGYEFQLEKILTAIAEIRSQLGHHATGSAAPVTGALKGRRKMSAAAKRRIGLAQKKRWSEWHAKQGKRAAKKVAVKAALKRKMSEERKAALIANLAKARAARAAKRAAM